MKKMPLKRKTRLKPVNPKRAKARKTRDFGEYAEWIARQPCVVKPSLRWLRTEAAHVRSRGAGGHAEGNLVSLCRVHHQEQHDIGIKSFQAKYRLDLKAIAASLWATYQAQTEGMA
jgi:Putative HNHc nuclease